MVNIIGVRFREAGKVYFFDPLQFEVKRGDHVIVETARGIEYGTVASAPRKVEEDKIIQPLKPVLRIATAKDDEQEAANRAKEKEAFQICLEKIRNHGLEMKLIDAEYTFDNNKVLFYFTADGRIDFRELVKDLAAVFRTRIELRQIGVRDETKILGGIGSCGRVLCCHCHLTDFIPVSIKMAKEQNLSLNPTKISGACGRLMCCLKHEEAAYEELNRNLPRLGDWVYGDDGARGEVKSINVLRQLVKVEVEEDDHKEIREYKVGQLRFRRKNKRGKNEAYEKELEQLEQLELREKAEAAEKPGKGERAEHSERPEPKRKQEAGREAGLGERREKPDKRRNPERSEGDDSVRRQRTDRRERSGSGKDMVAAERPLRRERAQKGAGREAAEKPGRSNRFGQRGEWAESGEDRQAGYAFWEGQAEENGRPAKRSKRSRNARRNS